MRFIFLICLLINYLSFVSTQTTDDFTASSTIQESIEITSTLSTLEPSNNNPTETSNNPENTESTVKNAETTLQNTATTVSKESFTGSTVSNTINDHTKSTTVVTTTTTEVKTTEEQAWAIFDIDCDSDPGYCYYNLSAPQLDKQQYESQQNNLTSDNDQFIQASSESITINSNFRSSEAYQNYSNLVDLYTTMEMDYKELIQGLSNTLDESNQVRDTITQVWDLLNGTNGVFSNVHSCYYQACSRYTTTTTTTTTPRPTTVSVCGNHSCSSLDGYNGHCYPTNGEPVCQCPGNLDPKNHCGPAACYPSTSGFFSGLAGPFWSVGYVRGNDTKDVVYGSNSNCLYKVSASNPSNVLKVNLYNTDSPSYNIDSTSKLIINNQYTLPSDPKQVQLYLDYYINEYPSTTLQFQFKSGSVKGKGYYFDFDIVECDSSGSNCSNNL